MPSLSVAMFINSLYLSTWSDEGWGGVCITAKVCGHVDVSFCM